MEYCVVNASRPGDNREYGAVYYGIRNIALAKERFLAEFPKYRADYWSISASYHAH